VGQGGGIEKHRLWGVGTGVANHLTGTCGNKGSKGGMGAEGSAKVETENYKLPVPSLITFSEEGGAGRN